MKSPEYLEEMASMHFETRDKEGTYEQKKGDASNASSGTLYIGNAKPAKKKIQEKIEMKKIEEVIFSD